MKGWGKYKNSVPDSVIPSSWRDMEKREDRFEGKECQLDDLLAATRLTRPDGDGAAAAAVKDYAANVKKVPKKKTTIKQLFSAASKFQKNLKRYDDDDE